MPSSSSRSKACRPPHSAATRATSLARTESLAQAVERGRLARRTPHLAVEHEALRWQSLSAWTISGKRRCAAPVGSRVARSRRDGQPTRGSVELELEEPVGMSTSPLVEQSIGLSSRARAARRSVSARLTRSSARARLARELVDVDPEARCACPRSAPAGWHHSSDEQHVCRSPAFARRVHEREAPRA